MLKISQIAIFNLQSVSDGATIAGESEVVSGGDSQIFVSIPQMQI